jgi:hypothetical protein
LAFWLVEALFDADELAELLRFCDAELEPPPLGCPRLMPPTETPPPLTLTGTLAFTPFWCALADELELCAVPEFCESP